MILNSPFLISARLMPAVRIADAFISIEYASRPGDESRVRYQYHIDAEKLTFTGDDLQSGNGNGSGDLQSGMECLLSFLGAAADAYAYKLRSGRDSENADLFPADVVSWAHQNSEEICLAQLEIAEAIERGEQLINEDE